MRRIFLILDFSSLFLVLCLEFLDSSSVTGIKRSQSPSFFWILLIASSLLNSQSKSISTQLFPLTKTSCTDFMCLSLFNIPSIFIVLSFGEFPGTLKAGLLLGKIYFPHILCCLVPRYFAQLNRLLL